MRKAGRKEIMAEVKFTEEKKLKAAPGFSHGSCVTAGDSGGNSHVCSGRYLVWGR